MKHLFEPRRVTLASLNERFPGLTWTAERFGFGWRYKGWKKKPSNGPRFALVQSCASIHDDAAAEWWVSFDGHARPAVPFSDWSGDV